MPFGEEIDVDGTYRTTNQKYGQSDSVRQRFTGYQKDEETGLDFAEARMYQNLHGRFTAIDPLLASGKSANPQTFNRYVYVMNSPLILSDPSGMQAGTFYKDLGDGRWALANYAKRGYTRYTGPARSGTAPDGTPLRITRNGWRPVDNVLADRASQAMPRNSPNQGHVNTEFVKSVAEEGVKKGIIAAAAYGLGVAIGGCVALCAPAAAAVGPPLAFATAVGTGVAAVEALSGDGSSDSDSDDVPNIYVSHSRHPESAEHIVDAQTAGYPSVLTIDRPGRDQRSAEALNGIPTICGCDRDEYPPAMFAEGGRGASVRHISPSDNRGAGASIMQQALPYPDGQRVRITVIPTLLRLRL